MFLFSLGEESSVTEWLVDMIDRFYLFSYLRLVELSFCWSRVVCVVFGWSRRLSRGEISPRDSAGSARAFPFRQSGVHSHSFSCTWLTSLVFLRPTNTGFQLKQDFRCVARGASPQKYYYFIFSGSRRPCCLSSGEGRVPCVGQLQFVSSYCCSYIIMLFSYFVNAGGAGRSWNVGNLGSLALSVSVKNPALIRHYDIGELARTDLVFGELACSAAQSLTSRNFCKVILASVKLCLWRVCLLRVCHWRVED